MTKEICLSNGMKVFVDDNDFEYLSNWNWYFCQGYACRMSSKSEGKRRVIQMHRIVLPPKTGFDTDHINGNTLDNRRSNLRYATRSQNNMNRFEKRLTSYSPFKGVCWRPIPKRWKAYIKINKKQIHYQLIHKLDIDSAGNLYVLESREPLEPDFDKMPKEQVDEYLRSHGYDPEQVGLRGKIFTEVLIKNIDLRARAEKAEKELAALYKLYEDACLTISQNEYAYDVDRQVLESELAALREQTRWIPVSERLPEAGENNYLTLSPSGEVFIMCFNEFWYSPFDENGDESVISVTHWMPLPEPPEEGTRSPGNYRNWRKRMGVIQRDRQC